MAKKNIALMTPSIMAIQDKVCTRFNVKGVIAPRIVKGSTLEIPVYYWETQLLMGACESKSTFRNEQESRYWDKLDARSTAHLLSIYKGTIRKEFVCPI